LRAWRQTNQAESLAARVRQFCAAARARFDECFDECIDLDAKRAFLREYVERIVFERGNIIIDGTVAQHGSTGGHAPFPHRGPNRKGVRKAVGTR
jgi:hypothetical protein